MPVKIVHPNHIEIMGFGLVLIASPSPATADLDMGQIAEEAALTSRAFAVIGKPTRDSRDPNKINERDQDLRRGIEGFLTEDGIRYLLEIEGKLEPGVEVAETEGKTCTESTLELVKSRLAKEFTLKPIESQDTVSSNGPVFGYSHKDATGKFQVETVHIVFGSEERQFSKEKVISVISEITDLLNGRVGPSQPTNADAAA